ncbi:hypothetical protein EZS27_019664 [termite gut metagenome]|uniref:Uncharacterized protein n=1 Tax=termite gut metagenome TaxID=433724 RepID=A0A5J4RCI4_9ZZZZ
MKNREITLLGLNVSVCSLKRLFIVKFRYFSQKVIFLSLFFMQLSPKEIIPFQFLLAHNSTASNSARAFR